MNNQSLKEVISDSKIICFGTGGASKTFLDKFGVDAISYFVDNNSVNWNKEYINKKIYSPSKLLDEKKEDLVIIVLSMYYQEIAQQLNNMGFIEDYHFFNGLDFIDKRHYKETYSQEGEDIVLREFLRKEKGFYVDVGAFHPIKYSNTYYFYKRGWRGINIEPMPYSKRIFDFVRPCDINLEIGISSLPQKLTYFIFNKHSVNTVDENLAKERINSGEYLLKDKRQVSFEKLSIVLDMYVKNNYIDFMSIDVEGHEMDVLKSNDWDRYRPDYLLVESLEVKGELENIKSCPIYNYLSSKGYCLVAKTYRTCFYKNRK